MKGPTETVAEMQSPSGKKWTVMEYCGQPRNEILIQGEFGMFTSTVEKAVRYGYHLLWSADDGLSRVWKTLSPSTQVRAPVRDAEPAVVAEPCDEREPLASEPAAVAQQQKPLPPVEPSFSAGPLRDRRSPESPASEDIRRRIAARDRETDRLLAEFPGVGSIRPDEPTTPDVFPDPVEESARARAQGVADSGDSRAAVAAEQTNPFSLF
jgi:hypothetical protein